jgi:hypothetical protein
MTIPDYIAFGVRPDAVGREMAVCAPQVIAVGQVEPKNWHDNSDSYDCREQRVVFLSLSYPAQPPKRNAGKFC